MKYNFKKWNKHSCQPLYWVSMFNCWLNTWFWCQKRWSEYFRNRLSAGIFPHNHLFGLQKSVQKFENNDQQFSGWKCLDCIRGQTASSYMKATVTQVNTLLNQGMQKSIFCIQWGATSAEDHHWCHSCKLQTGNWDYQWHGLTKFGW